MKEEIQLSLNFKVLVLLLISFFAVGFSLFGFTYGIVCPRCDGTGETSGPWFDFDSGTTLYRSFTCSNCGGSGVMQTPSIVSLGMASFIIFVLAFLALFAVTYFLSAFRLEMNPWVKDVKKMDFLLSPMYFVWLFCVDRKKWVKWNTVGISIAAPLLVSTFLLLYNVNQDTLAALFIGAGLIVPFTITWYQNFEKIFDFLM